MRTASTVFFAALALCLAAGSASASIIYETDVAFDPGSSLLPVTVGPFDPNQPSYGFGTSNLFEADDQFWTVLSDASTDGPVPFPPQMKLTSTSLVARIGANSGDDIEYFTGVRGLIYQFDPVSLVVDEFTLPIDATDPFSMATNGVANQVTLIGDTGTAASQGYLVDFTTNSVTNIFSLDGTNQAFYQSYAPNGLLYILDYGNSRMLMLDPANGYAQVGQFALNPDVTVANEQFGIGPDGDIYLGDGAGGGSAYSSTGTFLSTFGLPSGYTPSTSFQEAADVYAEADGSIYVMDPSTGAIHIYTDSDVGDAPEPSTMSLLLVGAGVGWFFRRRLVACGRSCGKLAETV